MNWKDDRTPSQRFTHTHAVVATDPGMSGWGGATGGTSVAAWACPFDSLHVCEEWVRKRGDMRRPRVVELATWRPRKPVVHVHIYVWSEEKHQ